VNAAYALACLRAQVRCMWACLGLFGPVCVHAMQCVHLCMLVARAEWVSFLEAAPFLCLLAPPVSLVAQADAKERAEKLRLSELETTARKVCVCVGGGGE
jgi:hypothetical protein